MDERHLEMIRLQTEAAKDPASYETYEYQRSQANADVHLFAARKKGLSHVRKHMPCQDYCMVETVEGLTVLADADGVSSCTHSERGARFACEAVMETVALAARSCSDEDRLVKRLQSVAFREKLVSVWIRKVMEEVNQVTYESSRDQLRAFSQYGSTLMFAVLTENWIVAGNLGDGQILLFNDHYGVHLRDHAPKESSAVRCLVNEGCVRQDFIVARYPRSLFNGVLLTTDGMYESLCVYTHLWQYAMQMKERFLHQDPPAPYQPFCYEEQGEPYKDFSQMLTQDDCSIALAIDEKPVSTDYEEIAASIAENCEDYILRRWDPQGMTWYTQTETGYETMLVKKNPEAPVTDLLTLQSAVLTRPLRRWRSGEYEYCTYPDSDQPTVTLECMFADGLLQRRHRTPSESEGRICRILVQLKELQRELDALGYELNSTAHFNILDDGSQLHVRLDAIGRKPEDREGQLPAVLEGYFSHVLGILTRGKVQTPVMHPGYINRGMSFGIDGDDPQEIGQVIQEGKIILLENISPWTWITIAGRFVAPGDKIELRSGIKFFLAGYVGEERPIFHYTAKESL